MTSNRPAPSDAQDDPILAALPDFDDFRCPAPAVTGEVECSADGSLHYTVEGSGPAVTFLHAAQRDLHMWDSQAKDLRFGYQVLRYDLRGWGRSSPPLPPTAYSRVEDLRTLLDHLGIAKTDLVGLSMGGGVALGFAMAYPGRVGRLLLASVACPGPAVPKWEDEVDLCSDAGFDSLVRLEVPTLVMVGAQADRLLHTTAARIVAKAPRAKKVDVRCASYWLQDENTPVFNLTVRSPWPEPPDRV